MNDLMDGLIQDMSTGTYTTKRPYPVARFVTCDILLVSVKPSDCTIRHLYLFNVCFEWWSVIFFSENQVSDSDDMDTQTTSSHAESGDAVVCNDEAANTESAEGGDFLSVLNK